MSGCSGGCTGTCGGSPQTPSDSGGSCGGSCNSCDSDDCTKECPCDTPGLCDGCKHVHLNADLQAHRKREGLCPECGTKGPMTAGGMFCPQHGYYPKRVGGN